MRKLIILILLFLISVSSGSFAPQQKPCLGHQLAHGKSITDGLVGCLLMNEGSGNKVYDLSGNGNTGTFNGDPQWVPGKFGAAIDFDGDGDYISVTSMGDTCVSGGTISVWAKINSETQYDEIITTDDSSDNRGLMIRLLDTLEFQWLMYNTEGTLVVNQSTGDSHYILGTWYHWVITWDSADAYLYENGQLLLSDTGNAGTCRPVDGFYVAADIDGTNDCDMTADNVMMFGRKLTNSEIALLYREPFCMVRPMFDYALFGAISEAVTAGQVIFITTY